MKVVENEAQIICGTELAKLLKIGTRVVRGLDWKLGNQGKQLEKLPSPITAKPAGTRGRGKVQGAGKRKGKGKRKGTKG